VIGSAKRTVITTSSYEARAFGVKTGMNTWQAKQKCPHIIFVIGDNRKYTWTSSQIVKLMMQFTPLVEVFSIDEAFLDLTGSMGLFGSAERIAHLLKAEIKHHFGITCSIGIAPNKLLAKLASEMQKPDGLTVIRPEEVSQVLDRVPAKDLCGISKRLLGLQISPAVGQMLHSSLLAGLVPVLIGTDAYDVVSSYADCVSGGNLHWIPVGGSIFEPSDLLARFDQTSRCLVPHPGGLLELLLDESDDMHIVVLEGFNRAAVDGYLMPLLLSVLDVAQGKKPRSIPLAPPGFSSEDDPYAGVSRIAWNRKVQLVLCPSFGTSTLPVPVEFWKHCTVVDTGNTAPIRVPLEPGHAHPMRVPASIWNAWSKAARENLEPLKVLRKQPKEAGTLPRAILENVERIFGSGSVLGLKHENALEQAVKTTLFPYLIAVEELVDVWSKHLSVEINDSDRRIAEEIKRLGE
jgi:hypothetical protein